MSKFDNVLNKYITEGSPIISTVADQNAVATAPPAVQTATAKIANAALGTPQNDAEKVFHVLATNPKINNIEDAFKEAKVDPQKTTELMVGYGLNPIGSKPQQPKTETPTPSTTQNPATTSSGNPTTDQGIEDQGSVGY
jgi:hypothetical protein